MEYRFNGEVAALYGINEAVFIHNLYWWIHKNEENDRHYIDGKHWTYNSTEAFSKLFPFWTKRQVQHIVAKLRDSNVILTANYNQSTYDRTLWYTLSDTVLSIYANCEMQIPKQGNANTQTVTPIPDHKPNHKPNHKPDSKAFRDKPTSFIPPTLNEIESYCKSRDSKISPVRFFDYFHVSGWRDSHGNMVRNWKQKLISWEQREVKHLPPTAQTSGSSIRKDLLDRLISQQFD